MAITKIFKGVVTFPPSGGVFKPVLKRPTVKEQKDNKALWDKLEKLNEPKKS